MERKLIIVIVVFTLGMGIVILSKWFFSSPYTPPEKPARVPESAKWFGDRDGGTWIELVNVEEEKFRFRIYRDWDGELLMDAGFTGKGRLSGLSGDNWHEKIVYYEYSASLDQFIIKLKDQPDDQSDYLIPVFPAYGGSDWEKIKEEFKLN